MESFVIAFFIVVFCVFIRLEVVKEGKITIKGERMQRILIEKESVFPYNYGRDRRS